ncbi:MAG: multicopper oxidase domain-containing protein [Deltaproteobacteria bacterium]|nr:multicopper oxidase domain-containing protein [Deltaproteobacteria bacterium]
MKTWGIGVTVLLLAAVGAGIGFAACPPGQIEAGGVCVCPAGQVEAQPGVCIIDGAAVPKYVNPLVIPPVMPRAGFRWDPKARKFVDYYEIEVTQFEQQILPASVAGPTTVWSYSAVGKPQTKNYPAFTIEAWKNVPTRVKWINNLKDPVTGKFLPHLLPVDQTLHWANPPQDCRPHMMGNDMMSMAGTDCEGNSGEAYKGPVPLITHVHGAHVGPESDGYPEAWWLPAATDIPAEYATQGSNYSDYLGGSGKGKGFAVFQYPNDQPAATLWYHDHSLGMTRTNVYAGPAGFYLLRDLQEAKLNLPGPAPLPGSALVPFLNPNDPNISKYLAPREIPIVIQDRSFQPNGALFYPDNRDFFEGLAPGTLAGFGVNFAPVSDVAPIWNPEAFFNTMVVNGRTWPFLNVEPRKYRFRFLNGCNSRFLILQLRDVVGADPSDPANWSTVSTPPPFRQIGSDQGLLSGSPAVQSQLLMGLAERSDVIVDFSGYAPGSRIVLTNVGPDEPFGGGLPGVAFAPANPATTGQVMVFNVVPLRLRDVSASPATLPVRSPIVAAAPTRKVSLNEAMSMSETVCFDDTTGAIVGPVAGVCPDGSTAGEFGPTAALLGTVNADGTGNPLRWSAPITENPPLGATETWEIHNNTVDAHPIHLHLVHFRVVNREVLDPTVSPHGGNAGDTYPPESWETGGKDTVIAYPGEITRVQSTFDIPGLYVWHCHIVEHEDNEMMRPYCVGDMANCDI